MPIRQVAVEELQLPTHTIDTFTGWTPPTPVSLVVAVSFGLLVPPRILSQTRYGGLNVHPSLLPHLRGPAPIEHAILKRYTHTGISIQTLHPTQFDRGTILAQTDLPGIAIEQRSAQELENSLAPIGARMLVDVIKSGRYLPPLKHVGWCADPGEHDQFDRAPKITKQDSFIDFTKATMDTILAMQAAFGDCWCILANGERCILHKMAPGPPPQEGAQGRHSPGIRLDTNCNTPVFTTADGHQGAIVESTYAGGKRGQGNKKVMQLLQTNQI